VEKQFKHARRRKKNAMATQNQLIEERYIPALRYRLLTPLYDPVLKFVMREETFKHRLVERVQLLPGQHVLDLGCGTGTLTVMLKRSAPAAHITGMDGDEKVLAIARAKARQAGVEILWDHGLATSLPYPDNSFDVVVSSLVVHHLVHADKPRAFQEVQRVLRPGGRFHLLDFGKPFNWITRTQAALMRHLEETADNFDDLLPSMLEQAAFEKVLADEHANNFFGPIWFYEAKKA